MSIETNTPKQKARLAKVRELLAKGENPYADIGKDKLLIGEAKFVRVKHDNLKELERKWQSGANAPQGLPLYRADAQILKDLGIEPTPTKVVNVDLEFCSFCEQPTPRISITYGKGHPRKFIKLELIRKDGEVIDFEQKVIHVVDRLKACPACVGFIKPILDRNGNLISSGIDIPNSD